MEIKQADFVTSAVNHDGYPEIIDNIEFAFVGKSNVGKSSLINSLTGRRKLAKTSKTPGRTQLINYFLINREVYFVDLPGYGFAKVPKQVKDNWGKIIEDYLSVDRKKLVFILLDIRRVPSADDINMLQWLEHYEIPYKIIFTKVDKFSNNQKFKQLKEIKKKLVFKNSDVLFYSSLNGNGKEELLDFIEETLKDYNESEEFIDERSE